MQNIRNIIFDLGGVFIEINYAKTQQAFTDLQVQDFHQFYTQSHANDLFEALEMGKIDAAAFYNNFRSHTNTTLADEQIEESWNALLGTFYEDRLQWLEGIKDKYQIFLLSNTNAIHHKAFTKIYQQQTGRQNFDDYFIKAYYSHNMGVRKPYVEAYEYVLNEQGLKAEETLFIDDTLPNVEGAQKAGLQTVHLKPGMSLLDLDL
jgi:putative hydrolase of the HAD superfamily